MVISKTIDSELTAPQTSRQRIVETARRLFIEHGYLGVSMQQIATEAGLRKASLYHHFPSKEALFSEVMVQEMDYLMTEFREADLSSGSIDERLTRVARINYRRLDQPEIHQLVTDFFRNVPESEHEEVHNRLRDMQAIFADIFAHAIETGELEPIEPNHLATLFFHMMMALANDPNFYQQVPPPPPDEAAALVVRILLHGIARQNEGSGVQCPVSNGQ